MSRRPFDLKMTPPIFGEIKNGLTNDDGYPEDLEYWRIVKREKKKNANNWRRLEDVHKSLGSDTPQSVPINLIADDKYETFSMSRGLFNKNGTFLCGSSYPNDTQDEFPARRDTGDPIYETDAIREDDDGQSYVQIGDDQIPVTQKQFGVAERRFKKGVDGRVPSYDVPCHESCEHWQRGRDSNHPRCELTGKLYFRLDSDQIPHQYRGKLFVFRATGSWSQRTIASSLTMISKETDGFLANLPLRLTFHQEAKDTNTQYGAQKVPMPFVEPRIPKADFMHDLEAELKRRRKRYKLYHDDEPSKEDLKIEGSINEIESRASFDQRPNPTNMSEEEPTAESEMSDELVSFLKAQSVPPRKREMLWDKHDGAEEDIREAVLEGENTSAKDELDDLFD